MLPREDDQQSFTNGAGGEREKLLVMRALKPKI